MTVPPSAPGPLPVSFDDVLEAADRLDGVAHRTPVVTSRQLDAVCGARVFLKCENFQRAGAFKFRGAYNALSRLKERDGADAVLTFSSGNHAQAVALAASLLGLHAVVVMPEDAPAIKRAATAGYGAEIVTYDRTTTSREELAARLSSERGLPVVPPYDHVDVVAGQGTAALELIRETGSLDVLVVCCGGGGLLSGSATSAKALLPGCRVVGVEPEAGDDATRSFRSGVLHSVVNPDTIADGARTPSLGRITFPIVMARVDDMVTVTDAALVRAMRFGWERLKLVMEPTGVLGLAAVMEGAVRAPGARIGVVISGGNVDPASALRWIA